VPVLRNAALALLAEALTEAMMGNRSAVRPKVQQALSLTHDKQVRVFAAFDLALAGSDREAQTVFDELLREFPDDTIAKTIGSPWLRATIEIDQGAPAAAIESLERSGRMSSGWLLNYGLPTIVGVPIENEEREEAAAEFRRSGSSRSRSFVLNYALSYLGLGRASALQEMPQEAGLPTRTSSRFGKTPTLTFHPEGSQAEYEKLK